MKKARKWKNEKKINVIVSTGRHIQYIHNNCAVIRAERKCGECLQQHTFVRHTSPLPFNYLGSSVWLGKRITECVLRRFQPYSRFFVRDKKKLRHMAE